MYKVELEAVNKFDFVLLIAAERTNPVIERDRLLPALLHVELIEQQIVQSHLETAVIDLSAGRPSCRWTSGTILIGCVKSTVTGVAKTDTLDIEIRNALSGQNLVIDIEGPVAFFLQFADR